MKKLSYTFVAFVTAFIMLNAVTLYSQEVVLTDQFDSGDGLWASGWIDGANTSVTVSIDTNNILSGKNSYKLAIVNGGANTWLIQRNADLPLVSGYVYTLSFLAVADGDASINALFEIDADPWTKRLNEIVPVTSTPQTFTYEMTAIENVPNNEVKLHFGGTQNNGRTIWIDSIVVTREPDPSLITRWGETPQGTNWRVLNDSSTAAGDASIGGLASASWATIRGEFDTLTATTDQAVVVTGKLSIVGGGKDNTYTPLRYAFTFQDSATLQNQYTDSALWVTQPGNLHYGFEFCPRTGSGVVANGAWGSGTVGRLNNGNWNSTNSNNGPALGTILQAPRNAEMIEGTYDFAISVHKVNDTINELRWYLVEEGNQYWFGGTVTDSAVTNRFNGVAFGVDTGDDSLFVLTGVRAFLGDPITVPEAPWEPYFIDQWGTTPQGRYFTIMNDSSTLVGDGIIAGTAPISGAGQATIRGGFGQNLQIKTDEALIVRGELELVGTLGGESSYNPLRYALSYHANDTLNYALTDSARWVRGPGYGYIWCPRTGAGVVANGAWGSGTIGVLNNGNWNSTNSNGGPALATILQAPRNAQMVPGVYEWAISVQAINDTTNEIRWYLIEEDTKYWFGGIVTGPAVTDVVNSINFGVNTGDWTEVKILAAEVDYGNPIVVPPAPWESYFVEQWGFFGDKMGGWTISNTDLVGNVTMSGTAANTDWAALRGAFETFTLSPTRPLKIKGVVEFVGAGFDVSGSFRMGVFYTDSAGTLVRDTAVATLPDSSHWTGTDAYSTGYLFIPQSGTNGAVAWGGEQGTWGAVLDTVWFAAAGSNNYPLGSEVPSPATGGAGEYEFEIAVVPTTGDAADVKLSFWKGEDLVWLIQANDDPLVTDKFNSIGFALNTGNAVTAVNITDVEIDTGSTTTGIEQVDGLIPTIYSLDQNYPNPFNPTTTIQFALPQSGNVKLVVYDILGSKIKELVNSNMDAGTYKVNFDASSLASGVYFYRIEAGDFVSVKKLMLLK